MSDETLPVLAELSSLESLRLEEARLKGDSLALLKHLPSLKKLTLEGIDIAEADLDRLKKELPGVDLQRTKPGEAYAKRIDRMFGTK